MLGPFDELQRPIFNFGSRRNSIDFTCSGCGDSFSSRNALFRHLRYHGCGSGIRRRSRRTLLLYGYVGNRFHGSQLNNVTDEERFPTVEGALLEAIRQAHLVQPHVSACSVEVCSRASRTDKGVHALASAVCLRITQECDSEFEDLQQSFPEMVGNYLPEDIAVVQAFDVPDPEFNARFACQKREYWYYVPYHHLLQPAEQQTMQKLQMDGMLSTDPLACQVWVSGLPETTSNEDLIDLVRNITLQSNSHQNGGALLDVQFSRKDGSAILVFADSATALSLCWKMDGAEGPLDAQGYRAPLLALPQSVMCKLQEVHKRLRSSLKKLTGTKSFHNFSAGFSNASDPKSIRSVYRCRSGVTTGFRGFLSGRAFAVLRIVGRDFLYHQIRGMVGMVCALTLGVVPDAYLDLALSDEVHIEVPLAPAGNLVLAECFFRDGFFGCPFGQAVREERDKAGGRRGLPGPAACAEEGTCRCIVNELCSPPFQESFRNFTERLLGEQGARMRQLFSERRGQSSVEKRADLHIDCYCWKMKSHVTRYPLFCVFQEISPCTRLSLHSQRHRVPGHPL